MIPPDPLLKSSEWAILNAPKSAPSPYGTTSPGIASLLVGSPAASPFGFVSQALQGLFAEDAGTTANLPVYDGGKIDAGGASKTTMFGPINITKSTASGNARADSTSRQDAVQSVDPAKPEPLSTANFPLPLILIAGGIVALILFLKK